MLSIEQWGDIVWTTMLNAFSGCSNLVIKRHGCTPTSGRVAIIRGNYVTSVDGGSLDAKEIIIESGGSLTLEDGYYVHIIEGLTTNGVLDVQLGGILEAQNSPVLHELGLTINNAA